jgi:Flp pilus assembly protein TadD
MPLSLVVTALEAQDNSAPVINQAFYLQQADNALRDGRLTQAGQMISWLEQNGDGISSDDVALLRAEHAIAGMDVAAAAAALSAVKDADRNICRLEPAKAWVAANRESFDDAIIALARAARSCPDDASIWNMLGLVLIRKGETEGAGDAFVRALALAPEQVEIRNNYALALLQRGDIERASEQLAVAASNAPGNRLILANLDFVTGMKGYTPERRPQDNDAEWSARLINIAKGAKLAARMPQAKALFSQALLTLDHFDEAVWTEITSPNGILP